MSTRGTAYFEILENCEPVVVGKIGIFSDAYPSGFGRDICKSISDVSVRRYSKEQDKRKVFNNIERVILYLLNY